MTSERGKGRTGRLPCTQVRGAGFLFLTGLGIIAASVAGAVSPPSFASMSAPVIVSSGTNGKLLRAPNGLTVAARAGFNLLTWLQVEDAGPIGGYRIYRSVTSGGPYALLSDAVCVPECVFMDRQVVNGTWYYYVIRAFSAAGKEGSSSSQISAQADTAPPAARITSLKNGQHFTGDGPDIISGTALDVVSGVSEVRLGIRRSDTKEWWNGKSWEVADRPIYLPTKLARGGIKRAWEFDARKVSWKETMAYTVNVMVRDAAGYELAPANTAILYVDAPAMLATSVAAAPAAVTVGQPINVSVLIANTGGSDAVSVRPTLPAASGSAIVAPISAPAVGNIPSLAPGEFATFSWTFSTVGAGTVRFTADAGGQNALTGVKAATVTGVSNEVLVRKAARLEVTITPSPSNVRKGTAFEVRMKVTNIGQSEAQVTSVSLKAMDSSLVKDLRGPTPAPPLTLKGGESIDMIWNALAGGVGEVAFSGVALGSDRVSGRVADSGRRMSFPVGVASAPASIRLAAAKNSAVIGSEVDVTAVVQDADGTPVPGVTVTFSVLAGHGSVVAPAVITDEFGQATTVVKLAREAGISTIEGRWGALLTSISLEAILPGGAEQVLSRNFFDPSRGETADVRVYQPRIGRMRVRVFNLAGDLVKTLADSKTAAGWVTYTWAGKSEDGGEVPNGVYFFSVQAGGSRMSRRIIVLRR